MPITRTTKFGFLAIAILFEVFLTLASTLYVPWRSAAFLGVLLSSVISITAIAYYVLVIDRKANGT